MASHRHGPAIEDDTKAHIRILAKLNHACLDEDCALVVASCLAVATTAAAAGHWTDDQFWEALNEAARGLPAMRADLVPKSD